MTCLIQQHLVNLSNHCIYLSFAFSAYLKHLYIIWIDLSLHWLRDEMTVGLKGLGWVELPRGLLCWNTFYDSHNFGFDYHMKRFPTTRVWLSHEKIHHLKNYHISSTLFGLTTLTVEMWKWSKGIDFCIWLIPPFWFWLSHDYKVRWDSAHSKVHPNYHLLSFAIATKLLTNPKLRPNYHKLLYNMIVTEASF